MELCLVVAERTLEAVRTTMDRFGDFVQSFEIRADYLEEAAYEGIETIRRSTPKKLIFTVREKKDGGVWEGSETLRRGLYERALAAGYDYVDLELGTFPEIKGTASTRIIRSHHDLAGLPPDMDEIYETAQGDPDELPKMAITLQSSGDVVRFLQWNRSLRRRGDRARIITAMGRKGTFSRILGDKIGTLHTYAPLPGRPLLPGMLDIKELAERYHAQELRETTRVYGLVDPRSTFVPSDAVDGPEEMSNSANSVYVPFILDSSDEMAALRDFFRIERFYTVPR